MNRARPGVLMVTGAYYPEMSGAGLQCRTLVKAMTKEIAFHVLTTTTDRRLPRLDRDDDVAIHRVAVDPTSLLSKMTATLRMWRAFRLMAPGIEVVHLHGFSQKSILLVLLARLHRKRLVIKLTSFGDDDPLAIERRGALTAWCHRQADAYVAVSPRFRASYEAAGWPPNRFREIANGVDVRRFRPPEPGERERLRRELNLPEGSPIVLFVGFFSREKQPNVLFDAWARVAADPASARSVLVFIGATRASYHEIDERIADRMRSQAHDQHLSDRLHFVESTHQIERYYRAADIFVLPSLREGMPNALLEAMASGNACIATNLAGITDQIVETGHNGLLIAPTVDAVAEALSELVASPERRAQLGREARATIESRFSVEQTARAYFTLYLDLIGASACAA